MSFTIVYICGIIYFLFIMFRIIFLNLIFRNCIIKLFHLVIHNFMDGKCICTKYLYTYIQYICINIYLYPNKFCNKLYFYNDMKFLYAVNVNSCTYTYILIYQSLVSWQTRWEFAKKIHVIFLFVCLFIFCSFLFFRRSQPFLFLSLTSLFGFLPNNLPKGKKNLINNGCY